MALLENRTEVLVLLKEHEIALHELYTAYSERFPYYKDFWLELAAEELSHADSVDLLQANIDAGEAIYSVDKFRPAALRSSIDYIERQTEEACSAPVKMINALSIALDLEESIIEKKYYQAVEGDTVEMKKIFMTMAEQSIDHAERIRGMWARFKR